MRAHTHTHTQHLQQLQHTHTHTHTHVCFPVDAGPNLYDVDVYGPICKNGKLGKVIYNKILADQKKLYTRQVQNHKQFHRETNVEY
jgi:hypothetical protein